MENNPCIMLEGKKPALSKMLNKDPINSIIDDLQHILDNPPNDRRFELIRPSIARTIAQMRVERVLNKK